MGVPRLARGVTHSDLFREAEGRGLEVGNREQGTWGQSRAREIVGQPVLSPGKGQKSDSTKQAGDWGVSGWCPGLPHKTRFPHIQGAQPGPPHPVSWGHPESGT